jgi:hypothetical protein
VKLPAVLSPGFVLSLPESERKKLGRAGLTPRECHKTFVRGQERELQKLVANWLDLNGIYFESDRMDKRTSGKRGRADFRICVPPGGYWLSAECKAQGETLEKEQALEAERLRKSRARISCKHKLRRREGDSAGSHDPAAFKFLLEGLPLEERCTQAAGNGHILEDASLALDPESDDFLPSGNLTK